ncbi:hypothetical protein, partial [Peptoniphilus harei]|uniref:hypothetical protein n=1 Tax=Peptoniphilus harei TaxID=54005 RepID=UPI00290CBAD6
MKWIYDDYEFENRANNLSWTIAGDYNESIDISEKDYSSKEIGLYFAIIAGARRKYVDWDIVKKYLTNRIRKGYNKDVILGLIQVILNTIVEEKVIKDRPGIEDIRRNAYKDIVSRFTKIHNDNIMDKIKYTFVLYSMDKHPALDSMTRRIVNDIRNIDTNQDIMEILKALDVIYLTYFEYILNGEENSLIDENNVESVEVNFDTFADFMYEELYSDEEENIIESDIDSISSSMLVEGVGDFDDSKCSNSADRVIYVDEDTANKIYSKIEHYYGKTYLSKGEIKKIETQNCRNVHEGCRIHFTDGVLRSECNNVFQLKYVTRQKENNLGKFREHARMYRQQIKRLKESLSRILIEENAKREAQADDIFAMLLGSNETNKQNDGNLSPATNPENSQNNENLANNEKTSQNLNETKSKKTSASNLSSDDLSTPASSDEVVANLQAASALNPKLQSLHDEFSLKLDEAAIAFRNKNLLETKSLINKALFDDYRNTKLEIAISNFTKPKTDQQIQQALRSVI